MRISDWSSDVCSSDFKAICLILGYQESLAGLNFTVAHNQGSALDIIYTVVRMTMQRRSQAGAPLNHRYVQPTQSEVERNAFHKWRCQATHFQKCRSIRSEERRVGKEWSVRVVHGGGRIIKKK